MVRARFRVKFLVQSKKGRPPPIGPFRRVTTQKSTL